MKTVIRVIFVLMVTLMLAACSSSGTPSRSSSWFQENGKLKILCTTEMIADVVRSIGGEEVDVITLITGELDPHTYELVKGDLEKLNFAQLVFANGLGLEHGPSVRLFLEENEKCVLLGDWIARKEPGSILMVDGMPDPHIWMDISMWKKTIPFIVSTLSQAKAEKRDYFSENGEKLTKEFTLADREVRMRLKEIPSESRYLVTSHDAFNYFARAYLAEEREVIDGTWEKRFEAPEGLAPDSQLSLVDIARLIQHLEKYEIRVLFPESNVSRDSLNKIMDAQSQKGRQLHIAQVSLYGDSMGAPGSSGDTYLKMIRHNAETIAKYLEEYNGASEK